MGSSLSNRTTKYAKQTKEVETETCHSCHFVPFVVEEFTTKTTTNITKSARMWHDAPLVELNTQTMCSTGSTSSALRPSWGCGFPAVEKGTRMANRPAGAEYNRERPSFPRDLLRRLRWRACFCRGAICRLVGSHDSILEFASRRDS